MAFSPQTFDLLSGLAASGKYEFVKDRRDLFEAHVYAPFKKLFYSVRDSLPAVISGSMVVEASETALFSKLKKNDYAKGGAWPYYWGAIYVGEKRQTGLQLFLWLNEKRLEAGFYIADRATSYKERFLTNLEEGGPPLMDLLSERLQGRGYRFGNRELESVLSEATWEDWQENPSVFPASVARVFSSSDVLQTPEEQLVDQCVSTFLDLFPLVLVGSKEAPMDDVRSYIKSSSGVHPIDTPQTGPQGLEQLSKRLGIDGQLLERWIKALFRKRQVVLFGPPGTSKTFSAERIADFLIQGSDGFRDLVQFHPAYAYEDFIQGRRPEPLADGSLHYPVMPGRFMEFCEKARQRTGPCVLVLDEMNRANVARVFGELMYLLEYRDGVDGRDVTIPLASGEAGQRFGIPRNVLIIGTMNTADRSIALVDFALRRRFAFLELKPNFEFLRGFHHDTGFPVDGLVALLERLNNAIRDPHYFIGTSYFLSADLGSHFATTWETEILPYLQEYFIDKRETTETFATDKVLAELGIS